MNNIANKHQVFVIYLGLIIATITVFWQVHCFDFVNFDDHLYVTENLHVRAGLTRDSIIWAFTSPHCFMWHPLATLSSMLDCQLFDLKSGWHHLTSLAFHIANTLLLFGILKKMTGRIWPSAFVAALFAVHPLNVESVAWISERKNVLSTFFWMMTIAAYIRYAEHLRLSNYLLVIFIFTLTLLSKPTVVTLPFVLLLLDFWPLCRFQWCKQNADEQPSQPDLPVGNYKKLSTWHIVKEKIPLFILSAILCVITVLAQRSGNALKFNAYLPFTVRLSNALVVYVLYIGKMIYPAHLAAFYPHPGYNLPLWKPVVSFLALAAVSIGVISLGRRKGYLVMGWFMFLGTLVPVIGLIQAGEQRMADRYTYIPLIGLFIIIAWAASDLLRKWKYRKIVLTGVTLAVLLVLAICCRLQLRYWHDNISLFEHATKVTENNYLAHNSLAYSFYIKGRLDESIAQNYEALKIRPNYPAGHNGIGLALLQKGKLDEAIDHFNLAVQINPDFADARTNLGYALFLQGKLPQAAAALARAVELNPESVKTRTQLTQVLLTDGKVGEAVKQLKILVRISSDSAAMNNLAWILAVYTGSEFYDPVEAVRLARAACKLTDYKVAETMDTLATAYAAAGRFTDAVDAAEKALKLAQEANNKQVADSIQRHLDLFRNHQPYVESVPK